MFLGVFATVVCIHDALHGLEYVVTLKSLPPEGIIMEPSACLSRPHLREMPAQHVTSREIQILKDAPKDSTI